MEAVKTKKADKIKSVNPADGTLLKEYDIMGPEVIDGLLEKADSAFREWKKTAFSARAEVFSRAAALMKERENDIARLCTVEMGKLPAEGVWEARLCASILEWYADNGERILADEPLETPLGSAFVSYEPIGVILSIQPWNFPYYQVIRSAAPHIMAGNTYVLKHASIVPQCAESIQRLFADAGLPEGVFTNVFVPGSQTDGMIASPYVKGITFTGSEPAGSAIAQAAAKVVKKTVLELGGSDPCIILDDMDPDKAVQIASMGRLINCGQICTSPKRIIVMESMAEQFIEKAKAIYEGVKVGDPSAEGTGLGPLSSEAALETVIDQVEKTVGQGAKLVTGGKRIGEKGAFMEPTILTDVKPGMLAYSEEVFGPVMCIYSVRDEDEAVAVANATRFGLGCSIFSADEKRAEKLARRIESGMVFINHLTGSAPELIFGGVKNSGYGRELSAEGMKEFVNHKLIRTSTPDAAY